LSYQDITAHKSLDLTGLRCPHLFISMIQAIPNTEPDQTVQIRATDLNAPSSMTAWSRQSSNELLDMYQEGRCFIFLLKREYQELAPIEENQVKARVKEESRKPTTKR